ncbi:hypothetical protein HDU91_002875, partial [Kappamyces sp. JEL0680]
MSLFAQGNEGEFPIGFEVTENRNIEDELVELALLYYPIQAVPARYSAIKDEHLGETFKRAALYHSCFLSSHPLLCASSLVALSKRERAQLATALYSLKPLCTAVPKGTSQFVRDRIAGILFHAATHCFIGNVHEGLELCATAVHWARVNGYLSMPSPSATKGLLDAMTGLTLKNTSLAIEKDDLLPRLALLLRLLRLDCYISIATGKSFQIDDS